MSTGMLDTGDDDTGIIDTGDKNLDALLELRERQRNENLADQRRQKDRLERLYDEDNPREDLDD